MHQDRCVELAREAAVACGERHDYMPATEGENLKVDVSKIETTLRDNDIAVRLDSFIDESSLRKVIGVILEFDAEQGYNDAAVTTHRAPVAGSKASRSSIIRPLWAARFS